jgi:hypothetical protein
MKNFTESLAMASKNFSTFSFAKVIYDNLMFIISYNIRNND